MKQINAWISDELAAELEAQAKAEDRSVSSVVRRLIMRYVEQTATERDGSTAGNR